MRRYTTPTLSLRVKQCDLVGCRVLVTISQGPTKIEAEAEPVLSGEDTLLEVPLTQGETARLKADRDCRIQVNWIDGSGNRDATAIKTVPVDENLLEKVVGYGD